MRIAKLTRIRTKKDEDEDALLHVLKHHPPIGFEKSIKDR